MSQPKIRDLEDGLIGLINADAAIQAYMVDVLPFSQEANILALADGTEVLHIARPPGFLVMLEAGGSLVPKDPLVGKLYRWRAPFRIFAFNQNLRSSSAGIRGGAAPNEIGVYDMLDDLMRVLGGARIPIAGISSNPIVLLAGSPGLDNVSREGQVGSLPVIVDTGYQSG